MKSFQRIALFALFFSLLAHILVFSLFSFRIPPKNTSLKPFVNFLGSFLSSYDTRGIRRNPQDLKHQKGGAIPLSHQTATHPHVQAETSRAALFLFLPSFSKKTLPSFTAPIPTTSTAQEDKKQPSEESFEYTPLKLPEYDHY